jgi:putative cardiolipin synthase
LRQGIELYELRSNADNYSREDAGNAHAPLTLHSKVAIVDHERLFVGSFNLDPRSLYINTEMGMMVESPVMASTMMSSGLDSLQAAAYQLQLNSKGRLSWNFTKNNRSHIATTEPETGFWRRFRTRLMGLLPIEGQM